MSAARSSKAAMRKNPLMRFPAALSQAVIVLMLLGIAVPAFGQQAFPGKPIRILIPFPPGGTNDILARVLGPKLTESWGQPVVIDNRPGGNTIIASDALLKSAPDGHTLLLPGNSHVLAPLLSRTPFPFDAIKDFAPVASLARTGLFLVTHPSVPAGTLREFIALARSKPGEINSAAPGGSVNQLATEVFNSLAGVKLQHIPYKGSAPAVADVVGGQAQLSFQTPASVLGHVRAGRLKALAISGDTPFPDPKVPTFAQAGLPGFEVELSFGLLAPAGTPKAIVDKLSAEVAKIIQTPEFRDKVAAQGLNVFVSTPEEYGAYLRGESEKFARVIKEAGIKPE
jgi:tripartite-type tricarboxylate transporter receptor subunit TctC